MQTCKAITAKGKPCQRQALHGDYCPHHSGTLTPTKFAEPLPEEINAIYQERFNEPHLLSLRHEIALVDTRLELLMDQLNTGQSPSAWTQLQQTFQDYQDALTLNDPQRQTHCLAQINQLINHSTQDTDTWNYIHLLIEQRRRLVEIEQRNRGLKRAYLPTQNLAAFAYALAKATKTRITNPATRQALEAEIETLLARHLGYRFHSTEPDTEASNEH